ncbi:MAG: DUF1990 domain-containing protein [Caldilinea sp. CFX5]|nr:DUF1990 domain-containing protein [Caldilinea sp. CFX5]
MRQFYLMRPTTVTITHFLQEQATQPFAYPAVGATQTTPPVGYVVDHNRVQLGSGVTCYQQACAALQRWEMFNLGWLHLCWPTTPVATGATVGVLAHVFVFHILNACRIVYTINEATTDYTRFGFAYGTLPGHIEQGEERFLIEWRHADDSVWYDILAFSQPRHWLVRLGYPVARHFQKRFSRDSKAAMGRAVNEQ